MQRGYVLVSLDLTSIVSIDKKNKKFNLLPALNVTVLNKAICFNTITGAKAIQKRIIKFDPNFPETKIINIAQLYNKVF